MRPLCLVLVVAAACGGGGKANPDSKTGDGPIVDARPDGPPIDANPNNPPTLLDTGLCLDPACTQISPDVHAYTPQFPLWSDTASKRRWIYLPPGTQIDTTDMDHWVFPVGTKLWKEFTRDGVRVETRLVMRISDTNPDKDWFYVAYAWNQAQDSAVALPEGMANANGTMHDIPQRSACRTCHENLQPSRVLGFGAIQLDSPAAPGEMDLDDVIAAGWLTAPPTGSIPHFPLPGAGTPAKAALGYMHANCGHCHNPTSQVYQNNGIMMVLRLNVGTLGDVSMTPPFQTAVNIDGKPLDGFTKIIQPGDTTHSLMIYRFESPNPAIHMPALGSEMTDPMGDTILTTWINSLPP
jgi:hypothetical protein